MKKVFIIIMLLQLFSIPLSTGLSSEAVLGEATVKTIETYEEEIVGLQKMLETVSVLLAVKGYKEITITKMADNYYKLNGTKEY